MSPQPAESFFLKNLYDVSGCVALVTGGGTGIGLAIAQGLAANGAKVYIGGRRKEILDRQAGTYGTGSIVPVTMDVTSKDSIRAAKAEVEKTDGKLHILVNNAGQGGPSSQFIHSRTEHLDAESFGDALFASESFEEWGIHFSANSTSIYFVSTAFLGLLAKGSEARGGTKSSIVNITSVSGLVKLSQDHFCYNSVKAAATHLTKIMATEFALRKLPIRVNSVAPGVYSSEMTQVESVVDQKGTDAIGKPIISIPEGRGGTEAEMAATVLLLVSPGGGYITGQELVVDGGYLAVNPSTR